MIDPHFVYFSLVEEKRNSYQILKGDARSTVLITSSCGPYKNTYGDIILQPMRTYVWKVRIIRGNFFKIGILHKEEIINVKKAFSDLKKGYAFYSQGELRNGTNNTTNVPFIREYGPGDEVSVKFDSSKGELSFAINNETFTVGYTDEEFKKGGYVPAISALIEGSEYSLILPRFDE